MNKLQHSWLDIGETRLHVVRAGAERGPLVILLHGFPEFWFGWRHQIGSLAESGYRVWVPDQRGYNLSAKPAAVAAYRLDLLAADVLGLIDTAGAERAFVIGHDWGGAVAWWLAAHHPERVRRLVVVNCPHWRVFRQTLCSDVRQLLRSRYMLFFQLPRLPEIALRRANWAPLVGAMRRSSLPGTFSNAEFEEYRKAWSQQGACRAMVDWYRAMVRWPPPFQSDDRVTIPTLLLWGARDRFLVPQLAVRSVAHCDRGRLLLFEDATHWVHHERAAEVNRRLLEFLDERK